MNTFEFEANNTSHAVAVLLQHEIKVLEELESSKDVIDAALNSAAKHLETTLNKSIDDLYIVEACRHEFKHAIARTTLSAWAQSVVLNALDRAFNKASRDVMTGVHAPVAVEKSMLVMEAFVIESIKTELPNVAALM